jgi:hypothetical protein
MQADSDAVVDAVALKHAVRVEPVDGSATGEKESLL